MDSIDWHELWQQLWFFKKLSAILRLSLGGKNISSFLVLMMTSGFTFQPFFCSMLPSELLG
jgi:hypothetical protein